MSEVYSISEIGPNSTLPCSFAVFFLARKHVLVMSTASFVRPAMSALKKYPENSE
jgi:hypothetical protein